MNLTVGQSLSPFAPSPLRGGPGWGGRAQREFWRPNGFQHPHPRSLFSRGGQAQEPMAWGQIA